MKLTLFGTYVKYFCVILLYGIEAYRTDSYLSMYNDDKGLKCLNVG